MIKKRDEHAKIQSGKQNYTQTNGQTRKLEEILNYDAKDSFS